MLSIDGLAIFHHATVPQHCTVLFFDACVVVARTRLQVGLSRLSEANNMVGTMQQELVTLGPRIEEKAKVSRVNPTSLLPR